MLAIKVNKKSMLRSLVLQGFQSFKNCSNFNQHTFWYTTNRFMIMFDDRISRHLIYSRITLKSIQCDWDEFFVASVITASKENLYQSQIAITYRFYFELTILIAYKPILVFKLKRVINLTRALYTWSIQCRYLSKHQLKNNQLIW